MQHLPSQQPPLIDLLDHHHPADPIAQHDEQQQSCVPLSSFTPSSTPSSPFHSPEPFSHPSSPIDNDNSLTHENLHLLDQSLALTDHGGLDDSEAVKAAAAAAAAATTVTDISTGMLTLGESYETIPTSSYVSFPSLSTSRSRANSIVSSAVMSTSTAIANNTSSGNIITSRRRRPRPWDNFNARNNDQDQSQPSEQQKYVETTPLLHSKQVKSSIHSIKTAKRGNAGGYMGRKRIMQNDDDNDDDASCFEKVEIQDASPSLEWKEGVFTDHYGSIHDGNGHVNGNWKNHHGNGGTFGTPSSGMFRHYGGATSDTCPDIPFMMIVMSLTVLQFVLMALYNIFLHYHSHRLNHQPPYAFWFSASGRIYNSGIGPNVPTLIMFGVFHPVLVMTEWWRMISGMVCCTSLSEFCFNVFWLRILMGVEEDKSHNGGVGGAGGGKRHDHHHHQRNGMALGFVFVMSSVMGALAHMIGSNGSGRDGGFIVVTGLNSAGIVGCMTAKGVMDGYWYSKFNKTTTMNSQMSYIRGYDGQTRKRQFTCCGPIGFVHTAIISELLCGIFLPYTSLTSILFGALMGVCCGMLLLNQKQQQWDDSDSQSSSFVSDLEEAFSLNLNTPQRMYYNESPPPPPSSSSKGIDTPIMRRSILTSPEEDDEYDLVQSLNESGGKGLKQRNVKAAQQRKSHESNVGAVSDDYTRKHSTGYICSEPRLRFIGLMGCLLMLSCSLAYIGLALSTPSDQVVSDSLYGCRTVHGFFQYAQDATVDVDDGGSGGSEMTSGNFNVYEGETVCGEICIPISIYHRVMNSQNNAISFLEYGSCSQEGYKCNYSSQVFDAGFTEIEQDLYKNGECVNTN
eukprot:CAMPEP_0176490822 /NCGR_PEP_ID=MMETSP0200_2-20121128/8085_1 /TAXON_ID=947934 /ORGANISM="Chaetoceros sp., Strain GSL56" /LENGTH=848 /DNA_ID=CAMNT_0017888173 /DNA_START=155 /DNA_END=2701 /DNA_ORIENTATION=-